MKIRPVGAEPFHADGQTDIMKVTFTFTILRTHQNATGRYVCLYLRVYR